MATILLLDDDVTIHELVSTILSYRHEVLHAYTIADALELSESNKLDIALVDITLGDGTTGLDALKFLQCACITLTSNTSLDVINKMTSAGAIALIPKPINASLFEVQLQHALGLASNIRMVESAGVFKTAIGCLISYAGYETEREAMQALISHSKENERSLEEECNYVVQITAYLNSYLKSSKG